MTTLPIQDAVLLALLIVSLCVTLLGDLSTYLRSRRGDEPAPDAAQPSVESAEPVRKGGTLPVHEPIAAMPLSADLLVVDDSAVARAKLRRLFTAGGYSLHLANDGVEALTLLGKGRYSMMVTDLEMPNMDGIDLIHQCRRQVSTASMPIIAVSAHENLRAKFNECSDICGVHRKPWVDDILLSHVATLVGTRSRVDAQADRPAPTPA